jgi:glycosyltransferase involved in cell wall biosynthesis
MHIVFLSYHYSPDINSPAEWTERIKYYVGWAEHLTETHRVTRVDQINYEGTHIQNNIRYHFINGSRKNKFFPGKLHKLVKSLNPDIVIVSSFMYPLQMIQLRAMLGRNVKIFVQHHAEQPFSGVKKIIQRFASRQINVCMFAAKETATYWIRNRNLIPESMIREFPEVSSVFYPVDQSSARTITGLSGSPAFIWVGRLNQNKNPVLAVKTFLRFTESHSQARLYMIYQTDELLTEIRDLLPENNNQIVLIGKVAHQDLLFWFNSADFYLSASYYEGSGTALCEAMSCSCIPVVSNIPSFRAMLGECGLLFEPGDQSSLLSALDQSQHLQVNEIKDKLAKRFESELSFHAIARKFQEIVDSL